MSLINILNLTFSYEGSYNNIFKDVSFQLNTDWKIGFTGRNGKGKTTFLNLLLGIYEFKGQISSSVQFEYFPYSVSDKNMSTINIVNEIYDDYEPWELSRELSLLKVSEDVLNRPFDELSKGEQTKILLAILFLKENKFLLIDEPTNHLDNDARSIVSEYLNNKKGYILVSHDRKFLDNCIDHILAINKTNIEIQSGNFSSWWTNKQMKDEYEILQNTILNKEINKLKLAAKRTEKWSDKLENSKIGSHAFDRGYIGHKAAKIMKRSKVIERRQNKKIENKSELLKNIDTNESLSMKALKYHKDTLIEINNLSINYEYKKIFNDVNFKVESGDRIVLSGRNGCGKTSVLKLLVGEIIKFDGDVKIGNNLSISYISQDTSFLKGSLQDFCSNSNIDVTLFRVILRKMDLTADDFDKDISDLSAGQKKKVLLAKSLCQESHLYIWDEPLNYVDVLSRIQIEELILKYKPTMIIVEHDNDFIKSVATRIINL